MKKWYWLTLLLCLVWNSPAKADDFTGILAEATRLNKENKPMESVAVLRKAITYVWNRMPLTIKQAILVAEKAPSYGSAKTRPDNIYKSGDPVFIYVEPVGYRFASRGDGIDFKIACDLTLLSKDGKVLGGQRDFGQWTINCGEPMFEFFMNLTITLDNIPPGEYGLEITFRDLNGDGQTSINKPVVVQ